jgi:UDP-2,4-diacetamido-2,4,6-trideoxy-beta-L-altropyranose hydrolase
MAKKLLILAEAGDGIGFGHYTRCKAIHNFFASHDFQADFILNVKGNESDRFDNVIVADWLANISDLNAANEYSHVLVDSYLAPLSTVNSLKEQFGAVCCLDDYQRINDGPDLIINPNVFGNRIAYSGQAVGGRNYVILRDAFLSADRKNEIRHSVNRVLLTVGGSDFRNMLPKLTNIIRAYDRNVVIDVVTGSDAAARTSTQIFGQKNVNIHGYADAALMKNVMLTCDIALSACGQTLHELAWLGVPSFGICMAHDQVANMKEYVDLKFLPEELYWDDVELSNKLHRYFAKYWDIEVRKNVSRTALSILNGKGLENIYNAINNVHQC